MEKTASGELPDCGDMIANYYVTGKFCGEITVTSKAQARDLVKEFTALRTGFGRCHPLGRSMGKTIRELRKLIKNTKEGG